MGITCERGQQVSAVNVGFQADDFQKIDCSLPVHLGSDGANLRYQS